MTLRHLPSDRPDRDKNTYLSDTESGAEMVRLLDQDHTLTAAMGGLLPELGGEIEGMHDILDLACGPGGWVQELAFANPQFEVTGVDISVPMIEHARMQARVRYLQNAHFSTMDVTGPLEFPESSFDLVNARLLAGFMLKRYWAPLLAECYRVLRPGGIVRLTETDTWGTTNSPAAQRLLGLANRAAWLTGHSFDPSGETLGVTPMLEKLLQRTGFKDLRSQAHAINFSTGALAHQAIFENYRVFLKLAQPFLLRVAGNYPEAGIPDQEELDRLYEQMLGEMLGDDFAGIFFLLTVWGRKP